MPHYNYIKILASEQCTSFINDQMKHNIDNVDNNIEELNNFLVNCASKCAKRTRNNTKQHNKSKPWFNTDCWKLKSEIKKLGKLMCKQPHDLQLRQSFYSTKRNFRKLVKYTKHKFKQKLTDELENSSQCDIKKYWQTLQQLKSLQNTGKYKDNPIPVEEWVKHFKHIYNSPSTNNSPDEMSILAELQLLEKTPIFNELSYSFCVSELEKAVAMLKTNRAAGLDCISGEIIKASYSSIKDILLKIFNHILLNGKYPKIWSLGAITPIHKKDSPLITDNYRGITITSSMSKLFSAMMNNRLITFCEKHNIISEQQCSHKKGARTSDNVFIIKSLYEKYCMNMKKNLFVAYIDFRKAFDSIWHEGLFVKLLKQGIGGHYYFTLKNMYMSNSSVVKINGTLSEQFCIKSGVRQGDILSPLLFNIFINDIVNEFESESSSPPSMLDKSVGSLLYADDLVILSTSPEGLQTSLHKLHEYCVKWKLQVNMSKTKTMCFSNSKKRNTLSMKYNKETLEQIDTYTYLGIEISANGSFKVAGQSMSQKAKKAMFKLKSLLYGSAVKPYTCMKLFDQLIKPIALYGSEIWGIDEIKFSDDISFFRTTEKFAAEKLNLSFSKFALGVHQKSQNSAVRGELGRVPMGLEIVTNILRYYMHINYSTSNTLLRDAFILSQSCGHKSWAYKADALMTYLKSNNYCKTFSDRQCIKQSLINMYRKHWKTTIVTESKMRTYIKFKTTFHHENYLNILTSDLQKSLTRFRISAHNLAIERGRYSRPPVPPELRICPNCVSGIQDEYHFLLECSEYHEAREQLLSKIIQVCPNFNMLSRENKLVYLLSAEGTILKEIAIFVHRFMP